MLSISKIAKRNIQRKPLRSFCLILTVMLLSGFVFIGSVLNVSLSDGAVSLANRLGADVMIVPSSYRFSQVEGIILTGKPSSFYLPDNALEEVQKLDLGIEKISPQTFLASFKMSCCSYPVQLIGIDYDSDFIIKHWLGKILSQKLQDGELIIGNNIASDIGEYLRFFGQNLKVAGKLEKTGMGFDSSVFVDRATIEKLADESERISAKRLHDSGSRISVIMLKLKPGYDSEVAAMEINRVLGSRGIQAIFSKSFVNNMSQSLMFVSRAITLSLALIWFLAVIIIGLLFALSISERRLEMGTLRYLGATRAKLIRIMLTEVLMISSYGAILGIFLGALVIPVINSRVIEALHLPFLLSSVQFMISAAIISGVFAILTGMLAALIPVLRAGRVEINDMLSEV